MEKQKLINNLKLLRKQKMMTQSEVALLLSITPQAYAHYEQGYTMPDIITCKRIAAIFGVSIEVLLGDKPLETSKAVKIPVLGVIPAGMPIEAIEDILDYEDISEDMARRGSYFALKVRGDSMTPTVKDGDVVIVRQQETAENGQICVVMINGYDATLKEIKKDPNGLWVLPHNPNADFKPSFFTKEEVIHKPVRIIGVAVEIRRSL